MYPPQHPAQLAAVRAGAGIGVVQRPVGLSDERLVPVLPDLVVGEMETRIVVHEDLRDLPRSAPPSTISSASSAASAASTSNRSPDQPVVMSRRRRGDAGQPVVGKLLQFLVERSELGPGNEVDHLLEIVDHEVARLEGVAAIGAAQHMLEIERQPLGDGAFERVAALAVAGEDAGAEDRSCPCWRAKPNSTVYQ
jgi:hypothetical protein